MANPVVSMPQITPAEIIARDERMASTVSTGTSTGVMHRSRTSIDRTRPPRSRQASLSYPASEFSDRDSFVSGIDNGSDEDDLDLDADDIPVTGFAVASARRNQEFPEMFPAVPEGDYLIEGAWPSYIRAATRSSRRGARIRTISLLTSVIRLWLCPPA